MEDESHAGKAEPIRFSSADVAGAHSKLISASLGEIAVVMARSKSHRGLAMSTIITSVLPAILSGQVYVVEALCKNTGSRAPVAYVSWASVSADVDERLRRANSARLHLDSAEWNGGDAVWIMDMAGETQVLSGALKNLLATHLKDKTVHAMLARDDGTVEAIQLQGSQTVGRPSSRNNASQFQATATA